MSFGRAEEGVVKALQDILESAGNKDWEKYEKLCDKDITCFEPESVGNVAKGLAFHKYYFDLPSGPSSGIKNNVTLADLNVRILGEGNSAVACYNRLIQKLEDGSPVTVKSHESRVFEMKQGKWVCVHFHRS
ncbi:hypothetical protein GUITHDRAFT_131831 [Guillardia theta CCMP2712]|uniref:Calcium/calmodulin-dependent protein kinase II association-domain domain-containing protein n=2 Tax=Guillardia theta TaxID=55529 RepID=L1K2L8_GUITC|nr:hypothetical protein GUITHDRAFT_131831 [Guillardia theta CCMP2712]EKX54834.1 hypothetical protein GUITHDRAFT_131831 [Guillardia theta CCMP2712]|eukprot:XP_005841814.1 hypothetical protein GUITHDRAFT_131831 [Guillardia theta CCMP2712]